MFIIYKENTTKSKTCFKCALHYEPVFFVIALLLSCTNTLKDLIFIAGHLRNQNIFPLERKKKGCA